MPQTTPEKQITFGQIVLPGRNASALPLERSTVAVQITGPLACVQVTQYFSNPLDRPIELEYLFPLPDQAAITGFELLIGSRRIVGDVQEITQARQSYEEAAQQGQQAGLLEARRRNLFAVRLANILPGERIQASVHYQERLRYDDEQYQFVFPMGLTPRYDSPTHPDEAAGIAAPRAEAGEPIGPVEFTISLDAGFPIQNLQSPSHALQITRLDPRRALIQLAQPAIPDHDLVLRYSAAEGKQPQAVIWNAANPQGSTFLAALLPPPFEQVEINPQPRQFIFVLDRSGSMHGQPIAQARNALRACLRTLNPQDLFSILLFDDMVDWYQPEPSHVTQAAIDQADQFLAQVEGRGGTEIIAALETALSQPAAANHQRLIVFLTDGAVSAEQRVLESLCKQLGNARLFTFGIGPSVNRWLLRSMAAAGRGTAEFLQLDEDIEGAILRFQDRVAYPLLLNLHLEWQNAKAWDVYPAILPDLYIGQPLEITGRLQPDSQKPPILRIIGQRNGQPITLEVPIPTAAQADAAVEHLWAQARLEDLLDQINTTANAPRARQEIIQHALSHQLVSPYTAFVALDPHTVSDGKPIPIQVAQPLPAGLDAAGFGGQPFSQSMPPSPSMPMPRAMMKMTGARTAHKIMNSPGTTGAVAPDLEAAAGVPEQPDGQDAEATLRWLARTQQLEGSWNGDAETTAAALLAFLRRGHTPRSGHYRQQVRRAVEWLQQSAPTGFAQLVRAAALQALAQAAPLPAYQQAAAQALQALGSFNPASRMETRALALLQQPGSPAAITAIQQADELQLAALAGLHLAVPAALAKAMPVWAAAV